MRELVSAKGLRRGLWGGGVPNSMIVERLVLGVSTLGRGSNHPQLVLAVDDAVGSAN